MMRSRRAAALVAAGIAAAGPLIIVLLTRFDGLYGQDAYSYYEYAVGGLRQSILTLSLPPPFFWPPGYPLLVALTSFVVGTGPVAGQIVSLVSAAAVPALTLLLAIELLVARQDVPVSVPRAALFAGVSASLNGQLWQSAMVVMSDTAALAAATLSLLLLTRFLRRDELKLLLAAAACWGVAIGIRWAYALLVLPWVIALWSMRSSIVMRIRRLAIAGAIVLATLTPQLAIAIAHQARGTSGSQPAFTGNLAIYRWDPLNFVRRQFVTTDGVLSYALPNGVYYGVAPARPAYLTPFGAAFAIAGAALALRDRNTRLLAIAGSWALIIYAFHSGAAWQNFRFTLAYLPPLAIFAGVGADRLLSIAGSRRALLARLLTAAVFAVLAAAAARTCLIFVQRVNQDIEVVRWTEQQVPSTATVLTFQLTSTFRHRSAVAVRELFNETPSSLAMLVADERPLYALIDVASLATQWQNRPPDANIKWLSAHYGLAEVGTLAGYTLYRVDP